MTDAPTLKDGDAAHPAPLTAPRRGCRLLGLTGFMGCGKSTVARLLARQIRWHYADLDKLIAERSGLTIPAIFAKMGEAAFRKMEHAELTRILGEAQERSLPTIISLGGGTTTEPQNVELLRQADCTLVWLHCRVEELLQRCSHITNRPLFRDEASFRQLYAQRLPFYEKAEYRVESSVEPLRVVQQIIALGILEGIPA